MRVLATPSATLAISLSRTGDCGLPETTRLPKAAASCGWSLARRVSCCRWPFSTPTGVEEFAWAMACSVVSKASPMAATRSGSSRTRTA